MEESPTSTLTRLINQGNGLNLSDWAFVPRDGFLKELLFTGNLCDWHDGNICSAGPPTTARWTGNPLKNADVVVLSHYCHSISVCQSRCPSYAVVQLKITIGKSEISTHKRPFSQEQITHDVNYRVSLSPCWQYFIPFGMAKQNSIFTTCRCFKLSALNH